MEIHLAARCTTWADRPNRRALPLPAGISDVAAGSTVAGPGVAPVPWVPLAAVAAELVPAAGFAVPPACAVLAIAVCVPRSATIFNGSWPEGKGDTKRPVGDQRGRRKRRLRIRLRAGRRHDRSQNKQARPRSRWIFCALRLLFGFLKEDGSIDLLKRQAAHRPLWTALQLRNEPRRRSVSLERAVRLHTGPQHTQSTVAVWAPDSMPGA